MIQRDFIFSNHPRHRVARHATFVFACWILFLLSFYLPMKVFPGWNTGAFAGNIARIGLSRWLWLRFENSLLIFLPLIAFAYAIIIFLSPRFLFNSKRRNSSIVVFFVLFIIILLLQYAGGWLVSRNWVSAGPGRIMPTRGQVIKYNIQIILFNYPIIGGFAIIIKMMKRSWVKQQEMLQVAREKTNAELQLLKSQIHPHFLFNTLNNIYFFTLTASQKAPEILTKLTDILRYILNECDKPLVPLAKELKMIEDYISLERIRYGNHLRMDIDISRDSGDKLIPPLLLIPLVENSFKHGASKMLKHPWVNLAISVKEQYLFFALSNSRPNDSIPSPYNIHIGLNNVKKRLHLLYPAAHELNISQSANSFEIFMKIRLNDINNSDKETKQETSAYAMA